MTKPKLLAELRDVAYPYWIDGHAGDGRLIVTWHVRAPMDRDLWRRLPMRKIAWSVRPGVRS